jgi:serine protease Do/serine protease DegQ
VVEVEPDSIADAAGLRSGDIITRIGEREITRVSDFHSHAAVIFVGDEVDLEVLRDGRSRQVVLEIDNDNLEKVLGRQIDARLAGTELQNFRNEDEPTMGAGVLVTDIDTQSAAYRFGLRAGDVLVAANRRDVRNLTELREGVRLNTRQLLLRVYRAGEFGFVAIR